VGKHWAILALNVRGIVLEDGPTGLAHGLRTDSIIAFLVGLGRPAASGWRRTAALVSGACCWPCLLNAEVIIDFRLVGDRVQAHSLTQEQTACLAVKWAPSAV